MFNGRMHCPVYMYDIVVKSSRSLSHLLMSSCIVCLSCVEKGNLCNSKQKQLSNE